MTVYDRAIIGMHHLNVTQIGSGYDGKNHYTHVSYEVDLAGSDSGIDYWKNMMPTTYWKCAGAFGTASTGNTRFFWSCNSKGEPKRVLCADGTLRLLTLAMTHSNRSFTVGKLYGYKEVMYQEGTAGNATGNHIHLEVCAGHVKTKVRNSKGGYNLANMLPANKVFFVLSSYTTITNAGGLSWRTCTKVPYEVKSTTSSKVTYKYTSAFAKGKKMVTTTTLNYREGASTSSKVLGTFKKGTTVYYYGYYALNKEGTSTVVWYKVTDGSHTGYVYGGVYGSNIAPYLTNARP